MNRRLPSKWRCRRWVAASWVVWLMLSPERVLADEGAEPVAVRALRDELSRAAQLALPDLPRVHHAVAVLLGENELEIEAHLGSVVAQDNNRSRILKVETRVGDSIFDNGNFESEVGPSLLTEQVAFEDDYGALRHDTWLLLDQSYKHATAAYEAKRAQRQSRADRHDELPDFSPVPIARWFGPSAAPLPPVDRFVSLARAASSVFNSYPDVHKSGVRVVVRVRDRVLVDTGGTALREASWLARIEVHAQTQADDGMPLGDFEVYSALDVNGLPAESEVIVAARAMAERLTAMRRAPVVDDYAGPILFEGIAAAQLMRVLFADELSSTPLPEPQMDSSPAQQPTFAGRLGWRVLPKEFDVFDNPTMNTYAGQPMVGGYHFDDEGVEARSVSLVQAGKLTALLGGRIPSHDQGQSNGHGRAGPTSDARGRASNLVIVTRHGLSRAALRQQLTSLARREGLNYALVVLKLDEPTVTAHALSPGSSQSNSDVPMPLWLMRVYVDGRVELVRGGELQALQTRDLRRIEAAGRDVSVYHYFASSNPVRVHAPGGDIPTSLAVPSLLLPDAEVRKPSAPYPRPPIIAVPTP